MPVAMAVVAIVLILAAVRGNVDQVASQLYQDVIGVGGFIYWVFAILLLATVGSALRLREPTKLLLTLIAVTWLLGGKSGFNFSRAVQQIKNVQGVGGSEPTTGAPTNVDQGGGQGGSTGSGGGGGSGPLGQAQGIIGGLINGK